MSNRTYYSAPQVGLPPIGVNGNDNNSPATARRRRSSTRPLVRRPQPETARQQQLPDRFNPKQSSCLVVERLRPDRNKDISEVVAQGDFMHKGFAKPTVSRRSNHIDNQFDIKNKAQMRDDLLPTDAFVKRVFYTIANRQGGQIDCTQFEESACVVFGRVNGLDVEKIPDVAREAHRIMLEKLPNEKKMTLENFHVALVAAGYLLMMKPLFSIRKFATTKEFGFLADNLGIEEPEDAVKQLDPNGTGRFLLTDFVWWAANRTTAGEFTLDMLPMHALSVTAPAKKAEPSPETRVSHAGRCAVSPRLKDLQKDFNTNNKRRTFNDDDEDDDGVFQLDPISTAGSSSSPKSRIDLPPLEYAAAAEQEPEHTPRTRRRMPVPAKRVSPRVVAFGQTTPRRESVVGQDAPEHRVTTSGGGGTPSVNNSFSSSNRSAAAAAAAAAVAVVVASPATGRNQANQPGNAATTGATSTTGATATTTPPPPSVSSKPQRQLRNHRGRARQAAPREYPQQVHLQNEQQDDDEVQHERHQQEEHQFPVQSQPEQQLSLPPINNNRNSASPPLQRAIENTNNNSNNVEEDFVSTQPVPHTTQHQRQKAAAAAVAAAASAAVSSVSGVAGSTGSPLTETEPASATVVAGSGLSINSKTEGEQQQEDADDHDSELSHHERNYDHLPSVPEADRKKAALAAQAAALRKGKNIVKKRGELTSRKSFVSAAVHPTKGRYQQKGNLQEIL